MIKILITGGHHNSALPLIDYINQKYPNKYKFYWIGNKYMKSSKNLSPEYVEIKDRNIDFYSIRAGKLFRATSFRYFFKIIFNLLLIPYGFLQALFFTIKIRPNIIMSFGGYIAVPVVYAGFLIGVKNIFTHEQTAVIGLANNLISYVCKKILVSWPVQSYSKYKRIYNKLCYVGLPLKNFDNKPIDSIFQFKNELPNVVIIGGKLGSVYVNDLVKSNIDFILSKSNLIWATGIDSDVYRNEINAKGLDKASQVGKVIIKDYFYEKEMAEILQNADVVISRSGAHTIYELAYLRIPCILIPIPWSSNNEQFQNAKMLESIGIAKILEQEKLDTASFKSSFEYVLNNRVQIKANSGDLKLPNNSASEIAKIIL